MFPVSDVIPSRTVPVVTVGLIVVNSLVFLYQVTLPGPVLEVRLHEGDAPPVQAARVSGPGGRTGLLRR